MYQVFHVTKRQHAIILFLVVLIIFVTLGDRKLNVRAAQGTSLELVAESDLFLDFSLQWTADSQTLWYYVATASSNPNVVTYNLAKKSINTLSDTAWPPVPSLNSEENSLFSPYIQTDYKGSKVPVAVFSPNAEYIVYASSSGRDVEEPPGSGQHTKQYQIMLANRTTKKIIDTSFGATERPDNFSVEWNRANNAFALLFVGEQGTSRALGGYISNINSQLSNPKISNFFQNNALEINNTYSPGGILLGTGVSDDLAIYGISDDGKAILTEVKCNTSSCPVYPTPNYPWGLYLTLLNMDDPNRSQVFLKLDGTEIRSASFSAGSEKMLWIVTPDGLERFDTISGKTDIIDTQITTDWAYDVKFSPDRQWIALVHILDNGNRQIYVGKLPN